MPVMPNSIIRHIGNSGPIQLKKSYKHLEVSNLTDMNRHDSNMYKNEEGGSPSNVVIYFRFRNTVSHFHNRYM